MIAITLVFFALTRQRSAMPVQGKFPADELTEVAASAAAQSDDGNLSVTIRVGNAADPRVGL